MSEGIWIALIAAVPGGLAAFAALRAGGHAKAARAQVENHHSTNMRVEGDERHAENQGSLHQVIQRLDRIDRKQAGMTKDIRSIRRTQLRHADQIFDLEETAGGSRRRPNRKAYE